MLTYKRKTFGCPTAPKQPGATRHAGIYAAGQRHKKELLALIDEGKTREEIQDALGLSYTALASRAQRLGIKLPAYEKRA